MILIWMYFKIDLEKIGTAFWVSCLFGCPSKHLEFDFQTSVTQCMIYTGKCNSLACTFANRMMNNQAKMSLDGAKLFWCTWLNTAIDCRGYSKANRTLRFHNFLMNGSFDQSQIHKLAYCASSYLSLGEDIAEPSTKILWYCHLDASFLPLHWLSMVNMTCLSRTKSTRKRHQYTVHWFEHFAFILQ